ncbi:MAG: chemotaxis-specific protein-glutamate methyltransferase CheB [Oscillospiraceae bacterium]
MAITKKNKILIVDDSLIYCELIAKTLAPLVGVEVAGKAINAKDADEKLELLKPDIVIVDMTITGIMKNEFIEKASAQYKADIIIISSLRENNILMSEAVKYVPKPLDASVDERQKFLAHLLSMTRRALLERTNRNIQTMISKRNQQVATNTTKTIEQIASENIRTRGKIVVIGASTGGTEATVEVVTKFPENMPPVLIVQHMPPGFTDMYAQRLNRICKMKAKEAKHMDRVEPGQILVAPGMKQMRIAKDSQGYYVTCKEEEKVSGHCPSVDVIFESVANVVGASAIGVILTGMGSDGANGLLKMRQKGAFTIGQDQDSCVVYGMPKVAFNIGAVSEQHSIEKIATRVLGKLGIK